jgi:Rrf2 family transcriptional regulator, cysteine metabolism repressor
MRISYKCDYALKAVLDLSLHYPGGEPVTIHSLASRIDAPVKFLERILSELKLGGLVETKRGRIGGYLLTKAPHQIKVGDVIRMIEGPIEPISCVKPSYSDCREIPQCVFRKIWRDVSRATADIVDGVDFGDLVSQTDSSPEALLYSI